jgi:hypothetical protein
MSITVTSPPGGPGRAGAFIVNGVSADASGCEELKAAPAAGKSIFVEHLTINNGANAISITIGEGKTGNGVTAALIGPIAMAANSSLQFNFALWDETDCSYFLDRRCFGRRRGLYIRKRLS